MGKLKYSRRLIGDFLRFAWATKAWWIVPVVLVLAVLAVLLATGQALAPFVYTLF